MGNTLDEKSLDRAAQPSHTTIVEEQTSSVSKKQGLLSPDSANAEFDPCAIAKPCSPFYLYKHESPRPSMEQSHLKVHDSSIHVSVYDLEAEGLTPAVSQIKKKPSNTTLSRLWSSDNQCMTKPKVGVRDRFRKLPKWQQVSTKLFIVLVFIGVVVGIAVGISIRVHGGFYKNANQRGNIS